jgi:hypothetical protein
LLPERLSNVMKDNDKKAFTPKLPLLDVKSGVLPGLFRQLGKEVKGQAGQLPNASIVYAVGAGLLFAVALYSLFTGAWFTALILLIPAGALVGFALHYLSYTP